MKKEIFFDRNFYLELLKKHVKDFSEGYRQNLAFIGDELTGKTFLILYFLNKFIDNQILPIYISIKREDFKNFREKFIGSLLYSFLNNSGIELKEDIDYLINKAEAFIPHTVKKIKELRSINRKKESIFLELLSLCDILNKETKKFCLVIFDEFQNLEVLGLKNLYKDWAKILVLQKNTMFIIISSTPFKAKRILSSNLNLLFGKFELIEIEHFDYKTAKEFLVDRLNGLRLENKLMDFLIAISDGVPFYLKIIAESIYRMKDHFGSKDYINNDSVFDILVDLLFEETGVLNQRFFGYLNNLAENSLNQDAIKILCCISCGYNRLKDIENILHLQKKNILKITQQLLQIDMITKNGDFFKINDRLFNLWLRIIYPKKSSGFDFHIKNQIGFCRKELEKVYNEFVKDLEKPILERLIEIMHLFEDAYVNIDNKRVNLVSFREIKPLTFEGANIKEGLIARSTDCLWIVAINPNPLKEKDVEEFSLLCSRYKEKKQRRIIVTASQIDTNVRLKAMEEKIWLWETKNLNLLCELFNRVTILG
jgi:hypothetical protein